MNMLNDHDSATVSLAGVMPLPLQKGWPGAALLSRSCRTSTAFINGDVANHIAIELRDHRGENRFVTGVASAECGNSGAHEQSRATVLGEDRCVPCSGVHGAPLSSP